MQQPRLVVLALGLVLLLPTVALAQTSIVGQIRDESGGVLPGVTVEASSPAIIEKVRTALSDDQGRYRIEALRPGVYKLTFTLVGFSTVVREGINLPSDSVVSVNVDLKVGALEETLTVTGVTPQVDIQQATRTQVIPRDIIDSLPISRNVMSLVQIVPGVRPGTPDIGGSRMTEQVGFRSRGLGGFDGEQLVEGMSIQSYEGASQSYFDETMQAEMTVSTSAISADTAGGGVRMNSILKDGGNVFSGTAFMGGSRGSWVKNNIDDGLRARNLRVANSIDHIENFMGSLGGPVMRDKVWWLLTARHQGSDVTIPNTPKYVTMPDGQRLRPTDDAYIRSVGTRLTWQAAQDHKFSGFVQRFFKRKGHSIGANVDPYAGEQRDPKNAHHDLGNVKWTSPFSNQWLLEAGYSWAEFYWKGGPPSGSPAQLAEDALFSPQWYATAETSDSALNRNFPGRCSLPDGCTRWNATRLQRQESVHNVAKFAASYVTGSHNIKVGFENQWGPGRQRKNTRNGHLTASYSNNVANQVAVFNNPTIQPAYVAYDVGLFAQDSWTMKRLTINPGLRVQWIETGMYESSMAAGRFASARFIEKEEGLIEFGPDYSPRLSAVYDLFGDGRTALKTSWSRYYRNYDGDIAAGAYGKAGERSENRQWFDLDLLPGTNTRRVGALDCRSSAAKVLTTDCDGVPQDNEIGTSPSGGAFSLPTRSDRIPIDLRRQNNTEFTAGIQHQVTPRMAAGFMLYKRTVGDLAFEDRTLITLADYTAFDVSLTSIAQDLARDPDVAAVIDANSTMTLHNLVPSKSTQFNQGVIDTSDTDNRTFYTGFEASLNARLPGGAMVFGSWTFERALQRWCDTDDNPNGPTSTGQFSASDATTGIAASYGGRFCDQTQFDYPFRHEFKVFGSYPLPYGLDFGAVLQSYPGQERVIMWTPNANLFPGGRTKSETVVLTEPGALFWERWNQLDINMKKNFRQGGKVFTFQVDLFNVFNANPIRAGNNTVGSSLGNATTILLGRFPRLAFQMKF
jgi:hypothetical protein